MKDDDDTRGSFILSMAETHALLRGIFSPTSRQDAFRTMALEACDSGLIFKREWIRTVSTSPLFEGKPLTGAELASWFKMVGFPEWFWQDFPLNGPDATEMQLMDGRFWLGLRDGIEAKKEWAFKIYAKIRFAPGESDRGKEDEKEILDFIDDKKKNGWRKSAEA